MQKAVTRPGAHGAEATATLEGVDIEARLEGLMLRTRATQRYRNGAGEPVELVYTFPAAWGTVLLGVSAEIGGKRTHSRVLPKKRAEQDYEEALDRGDTPIMVERSGRDLYTASLGNLLPGETALLAYELLQPLSPTAGRLRLRIPTVVGERYGAAGEGADGAGMKPHQVPVTDLLAERSLRFSLVVTGALARCPIHCVSHEAKVQAEGGELRLTVAGDACVDRDIVVTLEEAPDAPQALLAQDEGGAAAILSLQPRLPEATATPVRLKVLVDCSGSMAGGSIEQARHALDCLARKLAPQDQISYTRFGSSVQHEVRDLTPCDPGFVKGWLRSALDATRADMGGTELVPALEAVFAIGGGLGHGAQEGPIDILLITDGEVWAVERAIATARASGQRVFAIGVGNAPAESLLRELAQATGGQCELATPGEDIREVVSAMLRRMRSAQPLRLALDWGATPSWQSPLPAFAYPGETLRVIATFEGEARPAASVRVRGLAGLNRLPGQELHEDQVALEASALPLARVAGWVQLLHTTDAAEAEALALRHQLVSEATHMLLVHERAEGEKGSSMPTTVQVAQMRAAGQGGAGLVLSSARFCAMDAPVHDGLEALSQAIGQPASPGGMRFGIARLSRRTSPSSAKLRAFIDSLDVDNAPIGSGPPAFSIRQREMRTVREPQDFLQSLQRALDAGTELSIAIEVMPWHAVPEAVERMLDEIDGGRQLVAVRLAFLAWLAARPWAGSRFARQHARALRHALAKLEAALAQAVWDRCAAELPSISADAWGDAGEPGSPGAPTF